MYRIKKPLRFDATAEDGVDSRCRQRRVFGGAEGRGRGRRHGPGLTFHMYLERNASEDLRSLLRELYRLHF
jgi:hypothetical protein